MGRLIPRAFTALALLAVTSAGQALAGEPDAEAVTEALAHFHKGVELFEEGAHRAALVEFERAYDIAPNYRVLYNVGITRMELGDFAGARQAYEAYLEEGGDELPSERVEEVRRDLSQAQGRVAFIRIVSTTPSAQILVDGKERGTTPMDEPLAVNTGTRRITLIAPDGTSRDKAVTLASEERMDVHLDVPPTPVPTLERPSPLGAGFALSLGMTAAAATGALIAGILSVDANRSLDDSVDATPIDPDALANRRDRARRRTRATHLLLALTTVGAGVTLYLGVRSGSTARARVHVGAGSIRLRVPL